MDEHKRILEKLSNNEIPSEIDEKSFPEIEIFKELYDQGYIKAIDVSSCDGDAFLNPKITLPGREYLSELQFPLNTPPSIINNTIHINAPFNGNLQSGENGFINSSTTEESKNISILRWIMDNIIGVLISGLLLAALLAWLGLN